MEENVSLNARRIRKFMKHALAAGKRMREMEPIEAISKGDFSKSVKLIDEKLDKVIAEEEDLISATKREDARTRLLMDEISNVKTVVNEVWKKDDKITASLKMQIKEMQDEIAESRKNSERIEELQRTVSSLKKRMEEYIESKTERDRKIEEIENKIKSGVDANFNELLKIEEQLKGMEEKYNQMKAEGAHPVRLKRLKEKIDSFKQAIFAKKKKIIEEKEMPKMPSSINIPEPPKPRPAITEESSLPALPLPSIKFNVPLQKQDSIRHEMVFEPIIKPRPAVPAEEGAMPAPPMPPIFKKQYPAKQIELFSEQRPKKGFFDAIKSVFLKPKKKEIAKAF